MAQRRGVFNRAQPVVRRRRTVSERDNVGEKGTIFALEMELETVHMKQHKTEEMLCQAAEAGQDLLLRNERLERGMELMRERLVFHDYLENENWHLRRAHETFGAQLRKFRLRGGEGFDHDSVTPRRRHGLQHSRSKSRLCEVYELEGGECEVLEAALAREQREREECQMLEATHAHDAETLFNLRASLSNVEKTCEELHQSQVHLQQHLHREEHRTALVCSQALIREADLRYMLEEERNRRSAAMMPRHDSNVDIATPAHVTAPTDVTAYKSLALELVDLVDASSEAEHSRVAELDRSVFSDFRSNPPAESLSMKVSPSWEHVACLESEVERLHRELDTCYRQACTEAATTRNMARATAESLAELVVGLVQLRRTHDNDTEVIMGQEVKQNTDLCCTVGGQEEHCTKHSQQSSRTTESTQCCFFVWGCAFRQSPTCFEFMLQKMLLFCGKDQNRHQHRFN